MANENIGSSAGESSPQNKRVHNEREEWRPTPEDMKSTATTVAQDYTDKTSKALDEAKQRVRTLREDGEDYVRSASVSHWVSFSGTEPHGVPDIL
jgi:hypothetical protein